MPATMLEDRTTTTGREQTVRLVRGVMEALVLLLVCLSPWAFGAVEPFLEFLLYAGVAALMVLWAAVMLLQGRFTWQKSSVALCLAGLFLLAVWQLTPLPRNVLAALSPATARLYEQFLPAEAEVLPSGEDTAPVPFPPGSTLSLYPAATQRELVRLLAVFLVFAAVRNNLASPVALLRLSLVAVANGALLSLFALVQFFTSPHNTLYWAYPSEGEVFGPFICRNHFSFYVNVCVGLGLGLLLGLRSRDRSAWEVHGLRSLAALLKDSRVLWVSSALAVMVGAIALSLSRGGLLALLGAACFCLALGLWRSRRFAPAGSVALVAALTLLVLTAFGFTRIQARLATVWGGAAFENRIPLWSRLLPSVADFPLLGTGYGTFDFVEQMARGPGATTGYLFQHAHNDYLEALLEGGAVRLVLSLLAIALVCRAGVRAYARNAGRPTGGHVLGALFGFTAVLIHSFVDFGLHIPAIALLTAVVCAQLDALGQGTRGARPAGAEAALPAGEYSFRLGGLAPLAGAVAVVVLGLGLMAEGWRSAWAETWQLAASHISDSADPQEHEWAIANLEAAAALAPESGRLHVALAKAHLELWREQTNRLEESGEGGVLAQSVLALAPPGPLDSPAHAALGAASSWLAGGELRQEFLTREGQPLARKHLEPALGHLLQARDSCPLLADAQLQIAINVDQFRHAEPRRAYLERAKRLAPDDPEQWYLCGVQESFDGDTDQAWASWRRSLELSDRYQEDILTVVGKGDDVLGVLNRVLPERSHWWLTAAAQLYPAPEAAAQRRPLLEKAAELLQEPPGPQTAADWHTLASTHAALGQVEPALAAYRTALDREPQQAGWRLELARLLCEQRRFSEARGELLTILATQPGNGQAKALLETVEHGLARDG
jgi:O-antigen ligase/tetratricopeptide (TPR) repeat protein